LDVVTENGPHGPPVKPAQKGNDAAPPGGVAGQFDGPLHRLGAAVAEEEHIGAARE
jgi:hypothetical protein